MEEPPDIPGTEGHSDAEGDTDKQANGETESKHSMSFRAVTYTRYGKHLVYVKPKRES